MKKILLAFGALTLLSPLSHAGEPQIKSNEELKIDLDSLQAGLQKTDSLLKDLEAKREEMMQRQKDEMLEKSMEQNQRNLERFMADQKAREEKNSRRLWIRGGLLVVLLISFVVSRVQRKKKSES